MTLKEIMHFLQSVFTILAITNVCFGQDAGWYVADVGTTCNAKCGAVGLKCNADKQSTITSCDALKSALSEAGTECETCNSGRDYGGSPFFRPAQKDCYYLKPNGQKSVCDANGHNNHSPLCYCEKEEPEGCDVFDIDGFLTDCSKQFPAAKAEVDKVESDLTGEIARVDAERAALAGKLDTQVARLDAALSTAGGETTRVETKVDTQVARLDGLIGDMEKTLTTMANLNAAQSEFGNIDGEMMGDAMSNGTKNMMIYALILFNIGTLMVGASCLFWNNRRNHKKVIYDEVNQLN